MVFAHQRIRMPLAFDCEVAVYEVVTSEALAASSVVLFEDGEGTAREAIHVRLAG